MFKVLFLGDIVGKLGRSVISDLLPSFIKEYQPDFIIANGENATHGKGLSVSNYDELKADGINCVTMGNHFFQVKEIIDRNTRYPDMIRPYNLHHSVPGAGTKVFTCHDVKIRVTNLLGRVFVDGAQSNPFDCLEDIINNQEKADIHIVDFHAEATGEKMSMGLAFDGRVSAVIGTHTHVQTNDARILPSGTGFLSDAGMCGFYDGILGVDKVNVISRTWQGIPGRFEIPEVGRKIICGVVMEFDEHNGHCVRIKAINQIEN